MEILNPPTPTPQYAGFWLRLGAAIIDGIILSVVQFVAVFPILGMLGLASFETLQNMEGAGMSEDDAVAMLPVIFSAIGTITLAGTLVNWLYYALMESSAKQGTLGKMALGIKVTDINGNRISFLRATGRYLGKIISTMILFIGYLMAGITKKKQALHDIMADCLVIRN